MRWDRRWIWIQQYSESTKWNIIEGLNKTISLRWNILYVIEMSWMQINALKNTSRLFVWVYLTEDILEDLIITSDSLRAREL